MPNVCCCFFSFLKFTDLGQLIILAHHVYSSFVLIDEVKEITKRRKKNTVALKSSWGKKNQTWKIQQE